MAIQKSIGAITCWYGPYPWYLPYFMDSCSYNSTIDFFIITDNESVVPNKPSNVHIVNMTLDEVKQNLSHKLGFTVNIDTAYKLCDFKPAYGYMFPEIIGKYDFWAQSDLDVVFGNIRDFITPEMTEEYDFISMRHDYTTGCFALYRNNHVMNTFFMKSKDYRNVFSDPKHYCFDECNFVWDQLTAGISIFDIETEIESFTHLMKAAHKNGILNAHFDFILMEGHTGRVVFDNGRIIYKQQFEAILYHLFWLKKVYAPSKVPSTIPKVYYFSPTRIYHNGYKR